MERAERVLSGPLNIMDHNLVNSVVGRTVRASIGTGCGGDNIAIELLWVENTITRARVIHIAIIGTASG